MCAESRSRFWGEPASPLASPGSLQELLIFFPNTDVAPAWAPWLPLPPGGGGQPFHSLLTTAKVVLPKPAAETITSGPQTFHGSPLPREHPDSLPGTQSLSHSTSQDHPHPNLKVLACGPKPPSSPCLLSAPVTRVFLSIPQDVEVSGTGPGTCSPANPRPHTRTQPWRHGPAASLESPSTPLLPTPHPPRAPLATS